MSRLRAPVISVALHVVAGVAMARGHARPAAARTENVQVQVAIVEKAPPPPPPAPARAPPPVAVAPSRVVRTAALKPAPRPAAPPPPTHEAPAPTPDVPVVAGIDVDSTSSVGTFAVAVGNTLSAAPARVATEPAAAARPYKAARYAAAAAMSELPEVLNRDAVDIRRYYPKDALQGGLEGEVVLRLTIDGDGSIAEAVVVTDPGGGLGAAALRAIREFRFRGGRLDGAPAATKIPFVIRFLIG